MVFIFRLTSPSVCWRLAVRTRSRYYPLWAIKGGSLSWEFLWLHGSFGCIFVERYWSVALKLNITEKYQKRFVEMKGDSHFTTILSMDHDHPLKEDEVRSIFSILCSLTSSSDVYRRSLLDEGILFWMTPFLTREKSKNPYTLTAILNFAQNLTLLGILIILQLTL